jgi:hypothetical protein
MDVDDNNSAFIHLLPLCCAVLAEAKNKLFYILAFIPS